MLLFLDSCKSKHIYFRTTDCCLGCSSASSNQKLNDKVTDLNCEIHKSDKSDSKFDYKSDSKCICKFDDKIDKSVKKSEKSTKLKKSNSTTSVSTLGPDMQNLPINNQLNQTSSYQPQSYHQMNIQNNSLNFRYSPQSQYDNLDQQSQMTNYVLSNNVNNLNLNSPTSFNQSNVYFNNPNNLSPTNLSSSRFNSTNQINRQSPKFNNLSPNLSDRSLPVNKTDQSNLETFNFQNRTHIHGHYNEPNQLEKNQNYKSDYKDEYRDVYRDQYRDQYRDEYHDEYRSDYEEEDKHKNKFLSSAQNKSQNLPLSNVDLSPNYSLSAAPRTGSASPISSYNSPTVQESRIKKNKFNFKMKKFNIKGKKSSTKQSKKLAKNQKNKKPGLLYAQLNRGILNPNTLNSINKMQLSILNTGLIRIESEKANAIIAKEPFDLSTNKFIDHLTLLRTYNVLFKIEYFVACKTENYSFKHALKPENEIKNCNKKLLPYDYNRVVLETIPDVPSSDYINASHVDSILKPKAYIAAQGPTEETENDWWRMIYEQESHIIVMLTKTFDFIRVMCAQYWPMDCNKAKLYGQIEVTLLTEEPLADFYIRTFKIRKLTEQQIKGEQKGISVSTEQNKLDLDVIENEKKGDFHRPVTPSYSKLHSENDDFRIVYQFHYEKWPIHSCPYATSILQFRRRVRIFMKELQNEEKNVGPIIVHCSDGGGRTGSYLAIDSNLEYAKEDNMYDVFNYAKRLRQMRRYLIDGVDQYKFVYECLEEAHKCGKTWFPVSDLSVKMRFKSIKDPITKINEYQREYDKILKVTPKFTIGDCAGGHRVENRSKNRDVLTIPPDNYRPYLTTFQTNDSTDFVNAVFIDGYTRSSEYIVTEWPMVHTVSDCWSLIYDHDCNSVVILANPTDESTFPPFWPTEKHEECKYGPAFTVECISSNHYANIKCWLLKIHKKVVSLTELMSGVKGVPKMTQLFQITCWPETHKVPSSTNALVDLMNMVERWRQRTTYGPVVVISTDGCSRAGIYCAANVAIEQVVQHREVDVFQAVKTVRRHRPFLVNNLTEYKYCYDLILTYVINYLKPESPD